VRSGALSRTCFLSWLLDLCKARFSYWGQTMWVRIVSPFLRPATKRSPRVGAAAAIPGRMSDLTLGMVVQFRPSQRLTSEVASFHPAIQTSLSEVAVTSENQPCWGVMPP
jgi:hypothetical protein